VIRTFSYFMMKFFHHILFFLLVSSTCLMAQRSDEHKLLLDDLYPGEAVETFDLRERTQVFQHFFNDEWLFGKFLFENDRESSKDYMLRFDIMNQELNVNIYSASFIIPKDKYRGFVLKEIKGDQFVEHVFKYHEVDRKKEGEELLLYLTDDLGPFSLLKYLYVEELPSTYVPALDAGNLNKKVIQKHKYYLLKDDRFELIPKGQNKAKKIFNRYADGKKFLSDHNVNFKNENELIALINYLNQSYLKKFKS